MRWRLVGRGVALLAVVAACGSTRTRFRDPQLAQGERQLEYSHRGEVLEATNGLKILLLPDDNTDLVRVDVRYRVGSAEDPKDRSGLAHMVEHMTFELRPFGADGPSLYEKLGAIALEFNAYTSRDETHYFATATRDQLQAVLEIEAHRLRSDCQHLSDGDFAREREVVRQELAQRAGVQAALDATLSRAFYGPGHPYARLVIGSDEHLAATTRDDVCAFFQRHHRPGRAILVVSGAIDVKDVTALVGPLFGPIPAGTAASRPDVEAAVLAGTETWHKLDVEEATAFIAFNVPVFTHEQSVVERLLRAMYETELREITAENDFVTSVSVDTYGGVRAPLAVVSVSVADARRLEEAVKLVFDRRSKFIEELEKPSVDTAVVQSTSFAGMVNNARAGVVAGVEPFATRAGVFADFLQYSDHTWFVIAQLRALAKVQISQLRDQAEHYYGKADAHIAYVIPSEDASSRTKRAELDFSPKDYDLVDWSMPVDEAEAEQVLEVAKRKRAGGERRFELSNGLQVVLQPNLSYPVLDARIIFPAGRLHETKPGVATLAADELRDDLDVRLTSSQLEALKSVYRMGGAIGEEVGFTTTTFRVRGLAYFADGLLWRLNWRLESGVYRKQSKEYDATKQDKAEQEYARRKKIFGAVYGSDHPFAHAGSTPKDRATVTKGDLQSFRSRHYRSNGATLIVVGKFDADDVEKRVRRLFGSWSSGSAQAPPRIEPARGPKETMYFARFDEDAAQVRVVVYRALTRGFGDRGQRLVMAQLVQERLSMLREKLGATYGVTVQTVSQPGPGTLWISASFDADRAGEAFVAMQQALDELRRGELAAGFVRARRKVLQSVLANTVDSESVADEIELVAKFGLSVEHFDDLAAGVAALRASEVTPFVRDVLDARRFVVYVHGREADAKALLEAAGVTDYEEVD